MFGTNHLSMAVLERLLCSILSFPTSLRLHNLTTQEETLQSLESFALCQGFDRFYNISPMAEARDVHCCSHVVENFGKKTIPSDHAAVRFIIQKPANRRHQSKHFPSWMSQHSTFGPMVQQLHDDHRFSLDPLCALAEFQVFLHRAKKITKRELSRQTPDCIRAKLLITSTALRTSRNRHLGTLMRCCGAWKPMEDLISSDSARFLLALLVKTLKHVKLRSPPSLGRKQKKTLLWLDVGMDNVLGATRNLC